jgi:hypothetical protein
MQVLDDGASHDQVHRLIRNPETLAGVAADFLVEQ